ncbi:MAG: thiamine pyrophosphate-dependent enzyme [Longimicrobiales bacterium]|nr:thiamine pyrophosphate-dependent enzyme [Longimicrobiales bacterium]
MTRKLSSLAEPRLLLGDEAVALGVLDAGAAAAYAYPGTPSTEIFETLEQRAHRHGVTAHWCANEKTAYEQALGASMMNARVLVSMKHVGLNVAMDPFVNSALVGIRGGLVVVVADDPGMHSSQNEQDSRVLADFARVPCLEPADQQEAYDMTREAFAVSERFGVPVMVRLVTRVCHGRSLVRPGPLTGGGPVGKPDSPRDWVLLPANARRLWRGLLDRQEALRDWSEGLAAGVRVLGPQGARTAAGGEGGGEFRLGVVTTGIARGYLAENVPDLDAPLPHLHVGAYPLPAGALRALAARVDRLLVLEEGYPFLERQLRGVLPGTVPVAGKEDGTLPLDGELTPDSVRAALGLAPRTVGAIPEGLPARPPQLCPGCPHRDAYEAIGLALQGEETWTVTGDIGCYTLGALPPFGTLESCVCMGASVGMAKGASDVGVRPALAVIGDSTFLHSGVTPLMDAVAHRTPITVVVLDNETVGMTGQQPTVLPDSRLVPIVLGVGVDPNHVHTIEAHPRNVEAMAALLREEMAYPGVSVIVGVRECVVSARKRRSGERRAAPAPSAGESAGRTTDPVASGGEP